MINRDAGSGTGLIQEIIFMLGFYSIRYACTIQGANPARCQA